MKYIFHIMTIFVLSNAIVLASEEPAAFTHKDYSIEDLVGARLAWAQQEDRLGQLKYEASNIASGRVVDYVAGDTYVASINANDNTITTRLNEDKSVKLSYEDFNKLLHDKAIIDLANKRLKDQRESSKNKTASKNGWFGSTFKK